MTGWPDTRTNPRLSRLTPLLHSVVAGRLSEALPLSKKETTSAAAVSLHWRKSVGDTPEEGSMERLRTMAPSHAAQPSRAEQSSRAEQEDLSATESAAEATQAVISACQCALELIELNGELLLGSLDETDKAIAKLEVGGALSAEEAMKRASRFAGPTDGFRADGFRADESDEDSGSPASMALMISHGASSASARAGGAGDDSPAGSRAAPLPSLGEGGGDGGRETVEAAAVGASLTLIECQIG